MELIYSDICLPTGVTIDLQAQLRLPEKATLLSVKSTSEQVQTKLLDKKDPQDLPIVEVEFFAPYLGTEEENRRPVQMEIEYLHEGKKKVELLAVDYQFNIGDKLAYDEYGNGAKGAAALANQYRKDPALQSLLKQVAKYKKGGLDEKVERLKNLIHFDRKKYYKPDPVQEDSHAAEVRGEYYALSPTETLRYGGDCEDWSMLLGAFLVERGFKVKVAASISHAWLNVEGVTVDLIAETSENLRADAEWEKILFSRMALIE